MCPVETLSHDSPVEELSHKENIMRINRNISAVISNDHLLRNENSLAASVERLSSGLKINHAKDNPTGIAISIKMKNQIEGIKKASDNAGNGSSALTTADGAMNEMSSILQRMRELSVQAANQTNTESDKANIQEEISSLTEEIDRISTDTEFNTKGLLNGTLNKRAYTSDNYATVLDTTDVPKGTYSITNITKATQASASAFNVGSDQVISINGIERAIGASDTADEVASKLNSLAESAGVSINFTASAGSASISSVTSIEYGSSVTLDVKVDGNYAGSTGTVRGTDVTFTCDQTSYFTGKESVSADGQRAVIRRQDGFEMVVELGDKVSQSVNITATDIGAMYLQIGSNENQGVEVEIPDLSAHALGIDQLNVVSEPGADRAITKLDEAIDRLSSVRASLGAYMNRMDYTTNNLATTEENMTASVSRLEDVDMAQEMTTYTNMNILVQAATSVLAQANELPDQALQMLR